ncbi:pectinesterase family protein [Mucilaginibacter sp. RS28]|uniref:Pectinesterase n=1 Tax=Mucilaginibacter straminoryzae TaxID=2932774 RepID=A0A9X1X4J0_9SPHI|nr:pectinesterase family protein [Mucilaginibacter straminoryzae]MCJ8210833.1 pectinesterase family protein [Mucilaginibacter straminoryzae]
MKRLLLILACFFWQFALGQGRKIIVAADGTGDFKTVQQALDAVKDSSATPTTIFIKKGIYKEKLRLQASKIKVTMIGEDRDRTILTYDDYHERKDSTGKAIGTSGSASFFIYANNFTALNLTFQNTAGISAGQAVAVWVGGDRNRFKNCRFLGFQDTLYTFGAGLREYFEDCYIEGTVDFIFGAAIAWFERCNIHLIRSGYVTAASTPQNVPYGYIFNKCRITGNAEEQSFYLGRPWRPYAAVTYLNCFLDKQIKSEGWDNWHNAANEKTARFAEYNSKGPGASAAARVSWSRQLTDDEAKAYNVKNILSGADGWQPAAF